MALLRGNLHLHEPVHHDDLHLHGTCTPHHQAMRVLRVLTSYTS
jgi:hypothetical protein